VNPKTEALRYKMLFPERLSEEERAELGVEEMAPEVSEAEMEAFGQSRVKVRLTRSRVLRCPDLKPTQPKP
jgi:hypothetical protein